MNLISFALTAISIFITSKTLFNTGSPTTLKRSEPSHKTPDQKLIFILIDALRQDFVSFPYEISQREGSISTLNAILEAHPDNTVLRPMQAGSPTVTTSRVKSLLTGAQTPLLDMSQNFGNSFLD